jgi:hypothetical protein
MDGHRHTAGDAYCTVAAAAAAAATAGGGGRAKDDATADTGATTAAAPVNTNPRCQCPTVKGEACRMAASVVYEGRHLCRRHLACVKASEDCCICLDAMTPATRVRLQPCGHYVHRACLQRGRLLDCPLCRSAIEPSQLVDLHLLGHGACPEIAPHASHVLRQLLEVPVDVQARVLNLVELVLLLRGCVPRALDMVEEYVVVMRALYERWVQAPAMLPGAPVTILAYPERVLEVWRNAVQTVGRHVYHFSSLSGLVLWGRADGEMDYSSPPSHSYSG